MESWSYVSEGKGFVSEETISPFNSLSRSKNALLNWDLKTPSCSFGNNMLVSSQQAIENQGFGDYIELLGKQLPSDSIGDVLSNKDCGGKTIDPTLMNAFSGDDESSSKFSSSIMDSSSRDSSLIDLKLGQMGDRRDVQSSKFCRGAPGLSSSESSRSTPPKRTRVSGMNAQTSFCQVYGCNKDLSSSKEYHKRHKVCEIHSKTAKVIVNGIEQRFCQQCSRFHLLAEFDDGKRSCRKRLAGHNERRRKPQVGIHSVRNGRMLQAYGSRYQGTTSFICQDILPSGFLHPEKYGTSDWFRRVKVEDGSGFRPMSSGPVANGHLHSKFPFPHDIEKQFLSFQENGPNAVTASVFGDNSNQYPHDLGSSDSASRALFHNSILGSEDFNCFNNTQTLHGFSGTPDSGCALSLLSSQTHSSSSHLSGVPLARSLVKPSSQACYGINQVSDKLIGSCSQASTSAVSNKAPSLEINPEGGSQLGSIMMCNSSDTVNFELTDGIFQGSNFLNSKSHLSCEDEPTVDLLQLSLQLQRVKHQQQSMQMKQENDAFCCLRIT